MERPIGRSALRQVVGVDDLCGRLELLGLALSYRIVSAML
jgi:hypothetical protein